MEKLKTNFEKLNLLANCSKKIKDILIKKGEKDLILALNECVINTLNGNITLSPKDKLKLKKFKYSLRKLLKNKSIQKKLFDKIISPMNKKLIYTIIILKKL